MTPARCNDFSLFALGQSKSAAWVKWSSAHTEKTPEAIQEIAWKAQKRMCGRYKLLEGRGKLKVQVCTAIARELTGFIWAIGQAMPQPAVKA